MLGAWQNVLQESANAERFAAVLDEPDGVVRREHIRDIYHYLIAQQLLELSTSVRDLRNDKANRTLNTITSLLTGCVIGAVSVVGGLFLWKRLSSP